MTQTTRQHYIAAFEKERTVKYPMIDEVESIMGYSLDTYWMQDAALTLQCPVKKNPPNWQHGRVIYAMLRNYLDKLSSDECVFCLDIGTAKGYSALCMSKAITDHKRPGFVFSVDVVDPGARVPHNSIAEVYGPKSVHELIGPWAHEIEAGLKFFSGGSIAWLQQRPSQHIHFAFVDGKHSFDTVSQELELLADRQRKGDLVIVDDVQHDGVARAVTLSLAYEGQVVEVLTNRKYSILVRK